jgi:pectate lyase
MNDLDLGWNEVGSAVQTLASTPFRSHNPPQLHPRLLVTGVSLIDIKPRSGLTIFSANGVTIRHATFNIKSAANVIIRNLKFDEMWEWDEATKGQYDKNDWDFIDLGNGGSVSNIWVDHCTFTKTYDGILDTKAGSSAITISWCKYTGDDGATNLNSFVWQQINTLESNRTSYAFYNFLRNNGFSTTDIVTIIQGHDKTHLAGQNDLDPNNATISMTFHHLWLNNVWDRCVPRLRAGNVHDYNIYADDALAFAAKSLRNLRASAMSTNNQNTLNNTYDFNPPLNGAISTENGALLVEKSVYIDSLTPLRNNQTDPNNPAYTGKILALDTIYQLNGAYFRGNSTDPGGTNTLGPVQAPVIAFSWNLPGNQLPYSYTMDDPSQLQSILAAGTGAGVVNWNKTNWLLTTYAATAPVITAQPQGQSVAPSNSVTFSVVASGSANLFYQWYFNTNTPIGGATNFTLTLNNVQTTNAGIYSVVVTNSAGSVTSTGAVLTVSSGSYAKPQVAGMTFSNGLFTLTISGDPGPDYIVQASSNLVTWQSLFTNHLPTPPFNWSDTNTAAARQRFYRIQLGP